jgi:hypothetical protein
VWAAFAAIIPYHLGVCLESAVPGPKPLLFIAGELLTGVALAFPTVYLFMSGDVFDASNASYLERCGQALPRFAVSGALAGAANVLVRGWRVTEPEKP